MWLIIQERIIYEHTTLASIEAGDPFGPICYTLKNSDSG